MPADGIARAGVVDPHHRSRQGARAREIVADIASGKGTPT